MSNIVQIEKEYKELFDEPEASTVWKSSLYGISVGAWMYLSVQCIRLEYMARAGLLDGRGWFSRLARIYQETREIDGYKHKIEGIGWVQ